MGIRKENEMSDLEVLMGYMPLFIILAVIQYGLQIWGLIDLTNREHVRGKKWVWVIVIVLGEMLGPIIYLLFGRKRQA